MLNRSASLAMSTSILKALPDKLDIKRHSPSILYFRGHPWDLMRSGTGEVNRECVKYSHRYFQVEKQRLNYILLDFSLTVKAVTLICISWRGWAISSAK